MVFDETVHGDIHRCILDRIFLILKNILDIYLLKNLNT